MVALSITSVPGASEPRAACTVARSAPGSRTTATLSIPDTPVSRWRLAVGNCMRVAPSVALSEPNRVRPVSVCDTVPVGVSTS